MCTQIDVVEAASRVQLRLAPCKLPRSYCRGCEGEIPRWVLRSLCSPPCLPSYMYNELHLALLALLQGDKGGRLTKPGDSAPA